MEIYYLLHASELDVKNWMWFCSSQKCLQRHSKTVWNNLGVLHLQIGNPAHCPMRAISNTPSPPSERERSVQCLADLLLYIVAFIYIFSLHFAFFQQVRLEYRHALSWNQPVYVVGCGCGLWKMINNNVHTYKTTTIKQSCMLTVRICPLHCTLRPDRLTPSLEEGWSGKLPGLLFTC